MKKIGIVNLVVTVAVLLTISGCGVDGGLVDPPKDDRVRPPKIQGIRLVNYEDCIETEVELKELLVQQVEAGIASLRSSCWQPRGDDDVVFSSPEGTVDAAEESGGTSYTDTNIQEAGVDELDLIKTDGQYTYAIIEDRVVVAKVWPVEDFSKITTLSPEEGKPRSLFLSDNMLIVISTRYGAHGGESPYRVNTSSVDDFVALEYFDVTVPTTPRHLKKERYDGELISGRVIGSQLYVVFNESLDMPELEFRIDVERPECNGDGTPKHKGDYVRAVDELKRQLIQRIDSFDVDALVDRISGKHDGVCTPTSRSHAAFGSDLITVVKRDLSTKDMSSEKMSILGNGGTLYASGNNLFVGSKFRDFYALFDDQVTEQTVIHRIKIDQSELDYAGSNALEGFLLDNSFAGVRDSTRYSMSQFSMSEYDGHFRVAMTRGWWGGSSISDTYVATFKLKNNNFEKVGMVDGIGKDERLYAVRFIGDRAYIVTFMQIDPFFVVDLSEPTNPKVMGELEMPGFSTYLHPLDENRVIGLGMGSTDEGNFGWVQGVKLGLYDVSNPSTPTEVGNRVLGTRSSYSSALEEHHAFTFDAENRILALPMELFEGGGGSVNGTYRSSGIMLIDVDDGGNFETIGEVKTAESNSSGSYYSNGAATANPALRSVILGDEESRAILVLTESQLMMNMIDDNMTSVGVIE